MHYALVGQNLEGLGLLSDDRCATHLYDPIYQVVVAEEDCNKSGSLDKLYERITYKANYLQNLGRKRCQVSSAPEWLLAANNDHAVSTGTSR